MTWVQSYTGKRIELLKPTPGMISPYDIARGLAFQCRFNGQVRRFSSVAEHSVLVSRHAGGSKNHQLRALLHDAHEAYLGDVVRPLKRTLYRLGSNAGAYPIREFLEEVELQFDVAIAKAFGILVETRGMRPSTMHGLRFVPNDLPPFDSPEIRMADTRALLTERRDILAPMPDEWSEDQCGDAKLTPFDEPTAILSPLEAEAAFLERLHLLGVQLPGMAP